MNTLSSNDSYVADEIGSYGQIITLLPYITHTLLKGENKKYVPTSKLHK